MEWRVHKAGAKCTLVGTENGQEKFRDEFNPNREAARKKVAEKAGVGGESLLAAITAATPEQPGVLAASPPPQAPGCSVYLRGMQETALTASCLRRATFREAFDEALNVESCSLIDPIIYWQREDLGSVAALDIDFHAVPLDKRPSVESLECAAVRLSPLPTYSWATHGRGLRGIYFRSRRVPADELAACAAVGIRNIFPEAQAEIVCITRHPRFAKADGTQAGPVRTHGATADLGAVASWFARTTDDSAVQEWLSERGLEVGKRYEHALCPVDPTHPSGREPVQVGDSGVFCQSCAGRGVLRGSRKPGFFPWHALIPGSVPSVVATMAKRITHWEHAKFVVEDMLGMRGSVAALAYKAALRSLHDDDPRVDAAFFAGRDIVRQNGYWTSADGCTAWSRSISPLLASLPAAQYLSKGDPKPSAEVVNRFQERVDLTDYGYPPLYPIRGTRVYSHFLPVEGSRITAVMRAKEYAEAEDCAAEYVPKSRRMPVAEAWAYLDSVFPGLNHEYLTLCIAAKGAAEGQYGEPPRILCAGPAGSGKTQTPILAASVCGDRCTAVPWTPNLERFRAAIAEGASVGDFVQVDEIFKTAKEHRKSGPEVLNAFLSLTPESVSHKLYTGPVPMGRLPVIVATDSQIPDTVRMDAQVGRRFVSVQLTRRVYWAKTMAAAGVHQINRFRLCKDPVTGEPVAARAGNAVLSWVIDEFFSHQMTFEEIAGALNFKMLEAEEAMVDQKTLLRAFFDAVCQAPEPTEKEKKRWPGPGWKVVKRHGENDVTALWADICDNLNDGFAESRMVDSASWPEILGTPWPVVCKLSPNGGSAVAVRFVSDTSPPRYNKEVLP